MATAVAEALTLAAAAASPESLALRPTLEPVRQTIGALLHAEEEVSVCLPDATFCGQAILPVDPCTDLIEGPVQYVGRLE